MAAIAPIAALKRAAAQFPDDLIVVIPDNIFPQFCGPRAALEAEGLIKPGFNWPSGYTPMFWEDARYKYFLRRQRPPGAKGPMRLFAAADWWLLECTPRRGGTVQERTIRRMRKELADYIHRNSAAGMKAFDAQFARYWAARKDEAFQAFKARLQDPKTH